jgi:ABC-2 type transport system permease protein
MNTLPLLVKREYWEHRGGFLWTPIWITGVILALTILGMITAEVLGSNVHVHVGFSLDSLRNSIGAEDFAAAGNGLDMVQFMFGAIPCIGLFFVLFFYLLGALYDDRRDRSVLFWKSLPISDTSTVASKAIAAILLAPLIAFAISTIAYVAFLVVVSLWTAMHGLNILPAIAASHPFGMFWRMLLTVPVDALWAIPTVGWLLFWSAFVRSKPFLWAVMLPFLALFANWWLGVLGAPNFSSDLHLASVLARLLFSVMPGSWLSGKFGAGIAMVDPEHEQVISSLDPSHVYAVLATWNVWVGVLAGLALLAGAIWYRRRRIETNV